MISPLWLIWSCQDLLIRQHSPKMRDLIFADKFRFACVSLFIYVWMCFFKPDSWDLKQWHIHHMGDRLFRVSVYWSGTNCSKTFYLYQVLLQNDARHGARIWWSINVRRVMAGVDGKTGHTAAYTEISAVWKRFWKWQENFPFANANALAKMLESIEINVMFFFFMFKLKYFGLISSSETPESSGIVN